jgi:hypothetical protein
MQRFAQRARVTGSLTARRLAPTAAAALALILAATACPPPRPPVPPTPTSPPLPADAQDACPLTAATFNGWFQTGSATLNGVVNPANSLAALTPNCGFYQWSEQMFMWLTSPAPASYGGGGGRIVDSPTFFDVSPPDANGNRTLLTHSPSVVRAFPLRAAQAGAHGLPVVLDRAGRLREIARPDPKATPVVRTVAGQSVEIAHAKLGADGAPILLDKAGNVIQALHASPVESANQPRQSNAVVQRFVIDRIPIFIDPSLAVVDVEQGQSDSGVLEAQTSINGSLVYYATMVNDVYAYFLTGVKKGAIATSTPNQFPTTQTDLNTTIAFATANGRPNPPFPDPNALAVEVKSSWVMAAGLPNPSAYITMNATIPIYNESSPTTWTPTGQQTVQLALVGMHVVGSTLGHPEMVWATFEHVGNTPLAAYQYNSVTGPNPQTVPQSTSGTWLFSSTGSPALPLTAHMSFAGPPTNAINASGTFTISPSDTLRMEPWGIAGTNAFSNTEVISTNNHVLGMMAPGDVRGNYVMTGATWTPFGSNPVGANPGVGTNLLSNTTMETYEQGTNCFSCHQNISQSSTVTTEISHVFAALQPLF